MLYINALELINICVKNNILKEDNGNILIYRKEGSKNKEGWYLEDKDIVAKELMNSEKGQKSLISSLKKLKIEFVPTDYSWLERE